MSPMRLWQCLVVSGLCLSGIWAFFCNEDKSTKSSLETIPVSKQLEQNMLWSSKDEASGKLARVVIMIWLVGMPAKMAVMISTSLVSWFSALFTAALLGSVDSFRQGYVSALFASQTTTWSRPPARHISHDKVNISQLFEVWEMMVRQIKLFGRSDVSKIIFLDIICTFFPPCKNWPK